MLYDLTDRVDVGLEYRLLNNAAAGSLLNGGSAQVGYRVIKNLWFSLGYSFDRFDADLKQDSYWGQGPYFQAEGKDRMKISLKRSSEPCGMRKV